MTTRLEKAKSLVDYGDIDDKAIVESIRKQYKPDSDPREFAQYMGYSDPMEFEGTGDYIGEDKRNIFNKMMDSFSFKRETFISETAQRIAPQMMPELKKKYDIDSKSLASVFKDTSVWQVLPVVRGVYNTFENATVYAVAERYSNGKAQDGDEEFLKSYAKYKNMDSTIPFEIAKGVMVLPSFMAEFVGTFGASKAIGAGVVKSLGGGAIKGFGQTALQAIPSTIAQTAMMPTLISENLSRRLLPDVSIDDAQNLYFTENDDFNTAMVKALGESWVEVASERTGFLFGKVLAPLNKIGQNALMKLGIANAFARLNGVGLNKATEMAKKFGFHGIIEEFAEERAGDVMRAGLGIEEFKLPTLKQVATELAIFTVPATGVGMANVALSKTGNKADIDPETISISEEENKNIEALKRAAGLDNKQIEDLYKNVDDAKRAEVIEQVESKETEETLYAYEEKKLEWIQQAMDRGESMEKAEAKIEGFSKGLEGLSKILGINKIDLAKLVIKEGKEQEGFKQEATDPLTAEALKYDSAEEFVKEQTKEIRVQYFKKIQKEQEKLFNEFDMSGTPQEKLKKINLRDKATEKLTKKIYSELEEKIKQQTQQLTEIWNKSQELKQEGLKQEATDPLIEEARKYASAEEFVKEKIPKYELNVEDAESGMVGFGKGLRDASYSGKLFHKGDRSLIDLLYNFSQEELPSLSTQSSERLFNQFGSEMVIVFDVKNKKGKSYHSDADAGKYHGYDEFRTVMNPKEYANTKKEVILSDEFYDLIQELDTQKTNKELGIENDDVRNWLFQLSHEMQNDDNIEIIKASDSNYSPDFLNFDDKSGNRQIKTKQQLTEIWNKAHSLKQEKNKVTKGSYKVIDGTAILSLFEAKDDTTLMHEFAHHFFNIINTYKPEMLAPVLKEAKVKNLDGDNYIKAQEYFARSYEAYLRKGEAPTPELKSLFQKLSEWIREVYKNLSDMEVQLSPVMEKFFNDIYSGEITKPMTGIELFQKDLKDVIEGKKEKKVLDSYKLSLEEKQSAVFEVVKEMDLENYNNLREAMSLPTISKMNEEQIDQYVSEISKYEVGDKFFTKRTLETAQKIVDMKDIKTYRQAQELLAKKLGVPVSKVLEYGSEVKASDMFRYETALAEKNPFFKYLVERTQTHLLDAEGEYLTIEDKVQELAKKANKSRKKSVVEKLIPSNERIINYLEASPANKLLIQDEQLTNEELEYAIFIEEEYSKAYDYLIKIKALEGSRFEDNYFTHMRKGFLETWKDSGVVKAIQNIFQQQKDDQAVFNILDQDTGNILPKEKFFANVLFRSGEMDYSKNVTRVFLQYMKSFTKKVAFDQMIPELDIYVQSLTPQHLTPKGLEMDRSLKKFVYKYVNNKKGRKESFGGTIPQGGKIDVSLRMGNTLVSLIDLGLYLPGGISAFVGEQMMTYQSLGAVDYAKGIKKTIWDAGIARSKHKNVNNIMKQAKPFIGKNIFDELMEVDKPFGEKALQAIFGLYAESSRTANKIFLLASLTKEELESGNISNERIAEMKIDAGRWRDMGSNVKSIAGSTSLGATINKYKTWAIPIMRTTIKDIEVLTKNIASKNLTPKELVQTREFRELMRATATTAFVLMIGGYVLSDDDDDTFLGQIKKRSYREASTFLQGISPKMFLSTGRLVTFAYQLADNLQKIVLLESYSQSGKWGNKGELKGVKGLQRQLTPRAIKQFVK